MGVAVEFEDDEEDEADERTGMVTEVMSDEDADEEERDEPGPRRSAALGGGEAMDVEGADDDADEGLAVQSIDAYWLQREIGKLVRDSQKVVALEKEILGILPFQHLQECENKLVQVEWRPRIFQYLALRTAQIKIDFHNKC